MILGEFNAKSFLISIENARREKRTDNGTSGMIHGNLKEKKNP